MFGPLAGAVQWGRAGARKPLGWPDPGRLLQTAAGQPWLVFSLLGLAYAVGYQFIPLSRAPQASFDGTAAWMKGAYLLQGAAFPVSWLGRWAGDIEPTSIVVFTFLVALVMSIWRVNRQKATGGLLLVGWI